MNVALIFDSLHTYGGAERMLEVFLGIYPNATVFTIFYDSTAFPIKWKEYDIRPQLTRLPLMKSYPQIYGRLLVAVMNQIDLSDYDLIISLDTLFAKMVCTRPGARHFCYQFTPAHNLYPLTFGSVVNKSAFTVLQKSELRIFDYFYAHQVDKFIVISEAVRKRVNHVYGIDPEVLYPCVDSFSNIDISDAEKMKIPKNDFFLIVSRLNIEKSIEDAINACNKLNIPLVIAGTGPDFKRLKSISGNTVTFLGYVSDNFKQTLYTTSQGLIIPSEEDFGLTAVEALMCGTPVIYYNKGGVTEIVQDGLSGVAFETDLLGALSNYKKGLFDVERGKKSVEKFSFNNFKLQIERIIDGV